HVTRATTRAMDLGGRGLIRPGACTLSQAAGIVAAAGRKRSQVFDSNAFELFGEMQAGCTRGAKPVCLRLP
ncbi:hypothetical protein, partial [Klebsiella pneumoniae]|uniref:hypothetical protein n=1 Tax=Klebsiella pneumoniae TaxID=573 RepID=UPI00356A9DD1